MISCLKKGSDNKGKLKFLDGRRMLRQNETTISREIRVLAEVEKIWIIFDLDNSGSLDRDEIKDYIKFMAGSALTLNNEHIDEIYSLIDSDNDGSINKKEMEIFLNALMHVQSNLTFSNSTDRFIER